MPFKKCGVYLFNRAAIQIVEEAQGGSMSMAMAMLQHKSSNNGPAPEVLEGAPVPEVLHGAPVSDDASVPNTNEHSTQPCLPVIYLKYQMT